MPTQKQPIVVAKFDLSDEKQRTLHGAMRRMHTGPTALWRALRMRQTGHLIYEVAECLPRIPGKRPRYSLVTWNLVECGVTWKDQRSRVVALASLQAL